MIYEDLKIGNAVYTMELGGFVKESLYLKAINYTIYNEYYGNSLPEEFYKHEILIGKVCFYNYSILYNINGKNDISCKENCKVCFY